MHGGRWTCGSLVTHSALTRTRYNDWFAIAPSVFANMQSSHLLQFAATALLVFNAFGCSDDANKTYPVRGIVRFPDGKVLRDGSIEFEIMGRDEPVTATGMIGPDGSFELGTFELDDGAFAGKHRVVVISDYVIGNGAERPGLIPESALDPRYRDYRRSGLVHEVKPQSNNIVVEVTYAKSEDDDDGKNGQESGS